MQNSGQNILLQSTPYDINTLFTQLCQYKCFEVGLLRALFKTDLSLKKINLINSYWFDQWKKISCYETIKHELNMNCLISQNFSDNINNYYTIVQSINNQDKLSKNIENDYIISEFDGELNRNGVDYNTEFELISSELWNSFLQTNNNNISNEIQVQADLEHLTNDALIFHLSSKASYVIFWHRDKDCLGKLIFVFSNSTEKDCVIQGIKSLGDFIVFFASYLNDLQKENTINFSDCSFKCINKTDKKVLNYDDFRKFRFPVGLDNVRLTCYMNAALQSLFHSPQLTQYLLKEEKVIKSKGGYNSLLNEYLNIVLNLSKKADGSKLKNSFSPKEFFKIIENENEFCELAGDSIDMIRYTLENLHKQLNYLTNDQVTFSRYFPKNEMNNFINMNINNNMNMNNNMNNNMNMNNRVSMNNNMNNNINMNNNMNNNMNMNNSVSMNNNTKELITQQQILKLSTFINLYQKSNNSIISRTFYFIEKSILVMIYSII